MFDFLILTTFLCEIIENLQLAAEVVMIHHPDVGRYFQRFNGRCYVPNVEKHAQYPDDEHFYLSHYSVG
jgi:F-box protein 21